MPKRCYICQSELNFLAMVVHFYRHSQEHRFETRWRSEWRSDHTWGFCNWRSDTHLLHLRAISKIRNSHGEWSAVTVMSIEPFEEKSIETVYCVGLSSADSRLQACLDTSSARP